MRTHREANPAKVEQYNAGRRKARSGVYLSVVTGGRSDGPRRPRYSLKDFAEFCARFTLDTGRKFVLEAFERDMLADYFAGATETVVIIPKKNGKTTLLAALALYHLDRVPDAECVIGAASRDQARILFRQASGLVGRSKFGDRFNCLPGTGEIRLHDNVLDGRVRVLPADATTIDGVIPTLALVDELHRHPSADLYGVFRDGLGPRDGQMLTISTAGAGHDSPLGVLRDEAHRLPSFARDKAHRRNYARSEDGAFVLHEWCLDPDDDIENMETVKLANPASWQTPAALARRRNSPSMRLEQWYRFACGIWREVSDPWIESSVWDALATPGDIEQNAPVVVGIDLGLSTQDTGIVVLDMESHRAEATILRPPVSVLDIEAELRRIRETYDVRWFVYDPTNFRRSAEVLEADGFPMMEFPQSAQRMSAASATLLRVINEKDMTHDGGQAFRAHVLSGTTKTHERGWRLVKDPRTRRSVGALIALAMAVEVAGFTKDTEPLFAFG
jgi:phage terminase large subunit-like protein